MSLSRRRTKSLYRAGRPFGERLGLGAVVNGLLEGRGFGFAELWPEVGDGVKG